MKLSPYLSQKISYFILFIVTICAIIPVICIFFIIIKNGAPSLTIKFLTKMPKDGGILPAIVGTFILVTCSVIIMFPIGVFAAIYLNEYAKKNLLTRIIKLAIVNLAGIPSVVYGLFGLSIFVMFFNLGVSIVSGALTLSIMELPVIITTSRNALNNVPYSFREASLSLGMSRWQTVKYIVLPNAMPGILTGTILSIARISGETAPILFTAVAFYVPRLPHSIFDQVMTLPYHLYIASTQVPCISNTILFGTALTLLLIVLTISLFAIIARIYFRRHRKW
jgi:phosphate transport system permease protein